MVKLHLSREFFTETEAAMLALRLPVREATPVCGANDDVATVRRGRGEGLVPPRAWSPEFHCPECYSRMMRDPKAAE